MNVVKDFVSSMMTIGELNSAFLRDRIFEYKEKAENKLNFTNL